MIDPIDRDKMNWAKKTMLLTMPTSVPMPRIKPASDFSSGVLLRSSSEYWKKEKNNVMKKAAYYLRSKSALVKYFEKADFT